jgi:hypothetical protein
MCLMAIMRDAQVPRAVDWAIYVRDVVGGSVVGVVRPPGSRPDRPSLPKKAKG